MTPETLPDLTLPATGGQSIYLPAYSDGIVVLYFYPKDDTPGCTQEGQEFRDLYPQFRAAGAEVFGVSRDSVQRHEHFKAKYQFPFTLLADTDEALCQAFGVMKNKTMFGKPVRGIERSTFVFQRGKLVRNWRKVKANGHAAEVLAFVKSLS